jgi:2-oxoglutarate ferredoxin oxidoreductase subunit beta
MKKGFSFIEILSPCPVSYGKAVGKKQGIDFLREYRDMSVTAKRAENMSEEELQGKIVIGEFVDEDRKEFTEAMREFNTRLVVS